MCTKAISWKSIRSRKWLVLSSGCKGFVGILTAELHFPESGSLKGKRMYLRRIRDQVTRRQGASFAEIGHQDLWQRTRIVLAVAASDARVVEEKLDRLKAYLDSQEWMLFEVVSEVVEVDG
jgi:uncharacterized protein YlxP (DUF503 family)